MKLTFEWDPDKAKTNLRKHRVSFDEAATVFGDVMSSTFPDPDHSIEEDRYITVGSSLRKRVLIVPIPTGPVVSGSLVRGRPHGRKGYSMRKKAVRKRNEDLRPEYDLSKTNGIIKGKYAKRYQAGTNLALLTPEVAEAFPNDEAVNEALRMLMEVARTSVKHSH